MAGRNGGKIGSLISKDLSSLGGAVNQPSGIFTLSEQQQLNSANLWLPAPVYLYFKGNSNFTSTLQVNGDYLFSGAMSHASTSVTKFSDIITSSIYIEIVPSSAGTFMMGFVSAPIVSGSVSTGYSDTTGKSGLIYASNGSHYRNSSTGAVTATGLSAWAVNDVLQFGINFNTRTWYYSKNNSATVYSDTLPAGDDIYFGYGSGSSSGSSFTNFRFVNEANKQYQSAFELKTGQSFTAKTGWV